MSDNQPPFDLQRAHRWFAVELNNLSWDFVEAKSRTPDEMELMIHAAHGACYHWLQVGNILNHQRALNLLAHAYLTAGDANAALRHALKCLAISEEAGDQQDNFDIATKHGIAALAMNLAQQHEQATQHKHAFDEARKQLDHPDELDVVKRLYLEPMGKMQWS
jgi:hypothetical protein